MFVCLFVCWFVRSFVRSFERPVSEHKLLWQPSDCTTNFVWLILLLSEINMMMMMFVSSHPATGCNGRWAADGCLVGRRAWRRWRPSSVFSSFMWGGGTFLTTWIRKWGNCVYLFDRGLMSLLHDELHWLDVPDRVTYKMNVMVYRCFHGQAPRYLADRLITSSDVASRLRLRSKCSRYTSYMKSWRYADG